MLQAGAGSSLSLRSSSKLAGYVEAKCTTMMADRGRSWREGTMLSLEDSEVDRLGFEGDEEHSLFLSHFSGALAVSWHVFVLQQESFCSFL